VYTLLRSGGDGAAEQLEGAGRPSVSGYRAGGAPRASASTERRQLWGRWGWAEVARRARDCEPSSSNTTLFFCDGKVFYKTFSQTFLVLDAKVFSLSFFHFFLKTFSFKIFVIIFFPFFSKYFVENFLGKILITK